MAHQNPLIRFLGFILPNIRVQTAGCPGRCIQWPGIDSHPPICYRVEKKSKRSRFAKKDRLRDAWSKFLIQTNLEVFPRLFWIHLSCFKSKDHVRTLDTTSVRENLLGRWNNLNGILTHSPFIAATLGISGLERFGSILAVRVRLIHQQTCFMAELLHCSHPHAS